GERDVGGDCLWAVSLLITSETVEQRLARAWRECAAFVFAGEVALAEGWVAKQADLLALNNLGEADLEGAVDQIVGVLNRGDARQAMIVGGLEEGHSPPRRLVRKPYEPYLALLHELGQRVEDLRDGVTVAGHMHVFEPMKHAHRPVGPVKLIEVDVIGPCLGVLLAEGHGAEAVLTHLHAGDNASRT